MEDWTELEKEAGELGLMAQNLEVDFSRIRSEAEWELAEDELIASAEEIEGKVKIIKSLLGI